MSSHLNCILNPILVSKPTQNQPKCRKLRKNEKSKNYQKIKFFIFDFKSIPGAPGPILGALGGPGPPLGPNFAAGLPGPIFCIKNDRY